MSNPSNAFELLLARANEEARFGTADYVECRDHQVMLNGLPYRAFRQSVRIDERRHQGTFFSGPSIARALAEWIRPLIPTGGMVMDPTCGIGDLLLAYAELLPLAPTLETTLDTWSHQIAGIERRPDLVSMTKARLVALARFRGHFNTPLESVDTMFPHIVVGDMFSEAPRIARADGILFNPPFGQTSEHSAKEWGSGRISAAALYLDELVTLRTPGTPIAAILPEVLRCGTRYERFRARIQKAGLSGTFISHGTFDRWTDVDVFTTLLESRNGTLWKTVDSTGNVVGDYFTVKVGPVVPHRHPQTGPWRAFACAKTIPAWSTTYVPEVRRRFQGTVFPPPFVVVRRTSSPNDRERAVGALILGNRLVAVENHLIVLIPNDGRLESCVDLLAVLANRKTSALLNRTIRCRHLTTASIKSIPWGSADE